ncbi:L-threonine aldolase [Devosia enhydra]|uniref:L-threonine aldolase n=1 Tax=Devosia enhydra TaxID=665118 RepID=A0A1K2I250_9HYPH|nr:GntG family PLP-dependent aldolase [Devosia enhydra]SFZ86461.1 L-threonine aldolase [Devosia enhydra]
MIHDLRSDFLSPATPSMVAAMEDAARHPEGFGLRDDPHQRALEAHAAEMLGKDDALFVPTCTMANLLAALAQAERGTTVLADPESHCVLSEAGGLGAIGGLMVRAVPAHRGVLDETALSAVLAEGSDTQRPPVGLVVLETTHNRAGGRPLPIEHLVAVGTLAARHGVPLHLDGARLFNAAVAQGVPAATVAGPATSVTISLNKGLSAPSGAILAGPGAVIEKALVWRQRLGGGMRPAGALAAAGLVALDTMVTRLAHDHTAARALAEALLVRGLPVDPLAVETNILLIDAGLTAPVLAQWLAAMAEGGVLAIPFGAGRIRLVTHRGIAPDALPAIAGIIADAFHRTSSGAIAK